MIFREESNDDVVGDDEEEEDADAQNLKGCICSKSGSPFVMILILK